MEFIKKHKKTFSVITIIAISIFIYHEMVYKDFEKLDKISSGTFHKSGEFLNKMCFEHNHYILVDINDEKQILMTGSAIKNIKKSINGFTVNTKLTEIDGMQAECTAYLVDKINVPIKVVGESGLVFEAYTPKQQEDFSKILKETYQELYK